MGTSFNCQEYLKNGKKNWFPLARKLVSTSQNEGFCFKNAFPMSEK